MQTPLGLSAEVLERRYKTTLKAYKQHNSFNKGREAGKDGALSKDNPYKKKLGSKVLALLRQATYWEIGRELEAFNSDRTAKRIAKAKKEARRERKREEKKVARLQEKAELRKAKRKGKKRKHKRHHAKRHV